MFILLKYVQVFFPMIQIRKKTHHFYLICFNMKTVEIDVIDNINNNLEDIDRRYGPYANLVVSILHMLLLICLMQYFMQLRCNKFFYVI